MPKPSKNLVLLDLLSQLQRDFKELDFKSADTFYWSPQSQVIYYSLNYTDNTPASWKLLHETAHGLLEHKNYQSDFELLQLESNAWQKAASLANNYDITIDPEHIEDCLDSYRDWLYARSTCPTCQASGLMTDSRTYSCPNCAGTWQVSSSRFCRPYRRAVSI